MSFVPRFTSNLIQYERVSLEWYALSFLIGVGGNLELMNEFLAQPRNMMYDLMDAVHQIENSYNELVKNEELVRFLADRAHRRGMQPTIMLQICSRHAPKQPINIAASVGLAQMFLWLD